LLDSLLQEKKNLINIQPDTISKQWHQQLVKPTQ